MEGKLFEKDNVLCFKKEDGTELKAENAFHGYEGFYHLNHGWYIYPGPMDLTKVYEIEEKNENTCRIIRALDKN